MFIKMTQVLLHQILSSYCILQCLRDLSASLCNPLSPLEKLLKPLQCPKFVCQVHKSLYVECDQISTLDILLAKRLLKLANLLEEKGSMLPFEP